MGMSTYCVGFRPPDADFKKMKAAYDSCQEAGVEVPKAVSDFFDGEEPDEQGVKIDLDDHECCQEYSADMEDGIEIDIRKLPKGVKIIRFVNSY